MGKKVRSVFDSVPGGKKALKSHQGHTPPAFDQAKLIADGRHFWDQVESGAVKLVNGGEILPTDADKPDELDRIGAAATSLTPSQVLVWAVRDEA